MANTPYYSKAEADQKNKETFREVESTVQSISAGEGGKSFATLADAQAVSPVPSDGTVFQVENDGYYVYDSASTGGTRFLKKFIQSQDETLAYNLVPNANYGLELTSIGETFGVLDDNFNAAYQAGTPTVEILKNYEGFPVVLKCTVKIGDRLNFLFPKMDSIEKGIQGQEITSGIFIKKPSDYTGSTELKFTKDASTILHPSSRNELITVGNWGYLRFKNPYSVPSNNTFVNTALYLDNTNGTANAVIYLAAPAVVKTSGKIFPKIHQGFDSFPKENILRLNEINEVKTTTLAEVNKNPFQDSLFIKQTVGNGVTEPWGMQYGGTSSFQGAHRIVETLSPVGNRAVEIDVSSRSSDGFTSDNQLTQLIAIPENLRGRSQYSMGFYMKREDIGGIDLRKAYVSYYSDEGFSTHILSDYVDNEAVIQSETQGEFTFVKFEGITLPVGTVGMMVIIRVSSNLTINDTIKNIYLTGLVANFASGKIISYTSSSDFGTINTKKLPQYDKLPNKNVVWYGDSITASRTENYNSYMMLVSLKLGLTPFVRGIGSSKVKYQNTIAWIDTNGDYVARPPDTQPAGTIEIPSYMSSQQRIDAMIPLDTDIIVINGGTNDSSDLANLGTIDDVGTDNTSTTFYGSYQLMLDRIQARIPNAQVILTTTLHNVGGDENTADNRWELHREAIREIAKKYKLRLVEMSQSGINKNTSSFHLTDGTHPSNSGYKQMAKEVLRNFDYLII